MSFRCFLIAQLSGDAEELATSIVASNMPGTPQKRHAVVDVVSVPNWMWAWLSKRRLEAVFAEFGDPQDRANFELCFLPFRLYPNLPAGDNDGLNKKSFWKDMVNFHSSRFPGLIKRNSRQRRQSVVKVSSLP